MNKFTKQILLSKKKLISGLKMKPGDSVEEGGCGVVGFCSSVPVCGKNIFEASYQMHNRGNGKGGGIAAAKFIPEQLGVSAEILKNDYILQIALLDPKMEKEVESSFILPDLRVDHKKKFH